MRTKTEISGLLYIPNFVSVEEQVMLLEVINKQVWLSDLKRRVQHYGYKYDYKRRNIDQSMFLGKLPEWTKFITDRLISQNLIQNPDQLIVNEYLVGQGISDHIDCEPCFGETIISLTLGSTCVMNFKNGSDKVEVLLEKGSLVVLTGDARYKWTHGIPARQKDKVGDIIFNRDTRVSLTFRETILT